MAVARGEIGAQALLETARPKKLLEESTAPETPRHRTACRFEAALPKLSAAKARGAGSSGAHSSL